MRLELHPRTPYAAIRAISHERGWAEGRIQLELRAFPSEVKAGQSSGGRDDPPSNEVFIFTMLW
jgi:hypothetical protein